MIRKFLLGSAAVLSLSLTLAACSPKAEAPPAPAAAAAVTPTAEADMKAAIDRHVTNVKAGNVDGVMADYADDAIMVSPPGLVNPVGTFVGKEHVREFFTWLASPANLPGAQSMETTNEMVGPDTILFHWTQWPGTAKEVKGTDVFVFRNGKIIFQTTAPLPK